MNATYTAYTTISGLARPPVIPVKIGLYFDETSCNSCNFRQFRENLLYFYSISFPCELSVQIPEASRGFAPWTPILMINVVFLYITAECRWPGETCFTP